MDVTQCDWRGEPTYKNLPWPRQGTNHPGMISREPTQIADLYYQPTRQWHEYQRTVRSTEDRQRLHRQCRDVITEVTVRERVRMFCVRIWPGVSYEQLLRCIAFWIIVLAVLVAAAVGAAFVLKDCSADLVYQVGVASAALVGLGTALSIIKTKLRARRKGPPTTTTYWEPVTNALWDVEEIVLNPGQAGYTSDWRTCHDPVTHRNCR